MKIFKNKCSIVVDGATVPFTQLKNILFENYVLKKQEEIWNKTFPAEEGVLLNE